MTQESVRSLPDEQLEGELSPREVMIALSGVMLAMFVAMVSGAIIVNALPQIIPELGGGQTGYTWVVTAAFLTLTACTPLWGKLADLFDLKRLIQLALLIYVLGSAAGALSQSMGMLIGARAFIGIGISGLSTLSQAVIARLAPPRHRGKYAGYMGVTYALGTICGPLIGGVIADSPVGWRGCFFVPIPFAILSLLLMQRTLKITHVRREARVDYIGATLIVGSISLLLILLSLGGSTIEWGSPVAFALGAGGGLGLVAAIFYEGRIAKEPVIRLSLFRKRTVALVAICAPCVGVSQFGATMFLTEHYQYSHGLNPTQAGALTIPMIVGLTITGILGGRYVSRTGSWKTVAIFGITLIVVGSILLGTMTHFTPVAVVAAFSAVLGIGMGASTQNLILAVQNVVDDSEVASATALVTFTQSLGGTTGITVLGAYLSHRIASEMPELDGALPKPSTLPDSVREQYQILMGSALGDVFMWMVPPAALAFVACLLIPRVKMRVARSLDELEEQ